jgi:hypothetical protein
VEDVVAIGTRFTFGKKSSLRDGKFACGGLFPPGKIRAGNIAEAGKIGDRKNGANSPAAFERNRMVYDESVRLKVGIDPSLRDPKDLEWTNL